VSDSEVRPTGLQAPRALPSRDTVVAWSILLLLAVLAWLITIQRSGAMDSGSATMGMAFPLFILFWITMMAAMMLPSVAPVAVTWARAIGKQSSGLRRAFRTTQFLAGYLLAWAAFGCFAYAGLAVLERALQMNPEAGRWVGASAFAAAGLHQLGPLKEVCLRHCRSPFMQLLHYAQFRGWARDLRVGLHHGSYCVGCCWGLMVLLVPLGVMNIAAMAALSAVIFLEKLWCRGPTLARLAGATLLVLAVIALLQPWLLPGISPPDPMAMTAYQ
jgi:predicted metal-binding membrane protein